MGFLALASAGLLGACGLPLTGGKPFVVSGTETGVTLGYDSMFPPTKEAQAYCARYGRKPVLRGRELRGEYRDFTIHYYDCVTEGES